MLVTVVAQFTAKTTNSEKAIKFLPLMSCSINKQKFHMLFECKKRNFLLQEMLEIAGGGGALALANVGHNFNNLYHLASDSKDSVDFRIDHSFPVHANTNDHTSCTINHESNIEENENLLDRFRYAANQRPLIDKSLENEFYDITFC